MQEAVLRYTYFAASDNFTLQLFVTSSQGAVAEVPPSAGGVVVPILLSIPLTLHGSSGVSAAPTLWRHPVCVCANRSRLCCTVTLWRLLCARTVCPPRSFFPPHSACSHRSKHRQHSPSHPPPLPLPPPLQDTFQMTRCFKWGYQGSLSVVPLSLAAASDVVGAPLQDCLFLYLQARWVGVGGCGFGGGVEGTSTCDVGDLHRYH